mmetsp:Transcript_124571/g.195200  ORF Transcript_124571/g.195200 Transcript_124571/m.195200 type:complete len:411 (+) Transcript_124571:2-1234(+)
MRGLVIEKRLGNFLKIDRHKYVKIALHGTQAYTSEERKYIYRPTIDGTRGYKHYDFVKMDTLFQIVDAELYAQLVDLKDSDPIEEIDRTYLEMYQDVRSAVDGCHRDGTIKEEVARNPSLYIKPDPHVLPALQAFKKSGKKVFLLTNSEWEYTNVVMNHLWGNTPETRDYEWTSLFDLVICMACKPKFLQDVSIPLYRVRPSDSMLAPVYNIDKNLSSFFAKGKVFYGGNYLRLHEMLGLETGERLLYVGDHMYADITRSKRTLGWRTCLIIPELENELDVLRSSIGQLQLNKVQQLRIEQQKLDDDLNDLYFCSHGLASKDDAWMKGEEAGIKAKIHDNKEQLQEASLEYHTSFHPLWGQLFKAGYQESLFGNQVTTYACIYTSSVGNFRLVSPCRRFRPSVDGIPHER